MRRQRVPYLMHAMVVDALFILFVRCDGRVVEVVRACNDGEEDGKTQLAAERTADSAPSSGTH